MIPGAILVIGLMAAGAALLIRLMVVLMGRYGGEPISAMRESATFIAHTHRVPRGWRDRMRRRYPGLTPGPDDGDAVGGAGGNPEAGAARREADSRRARRNAVRRLDRLIRHFSRTSLVVDEAERDEIVGSLKRVREEWSSSTWDDIVS